MNLRVQDYLTANQENGKKEIITEIGKKMQE